MCNEWGRAIRRGLRTICRRSDIEFYSTNESENNSHIEKCIKGVIIMPDSGSISYCSRSARPWARMERWERKNFHQINATRALRGQPPLKKP
jgi:hypothetical protein